MNNLYLFLYFFAYHLATSGVPPVVRVPPVENRWPVQCIPAIHLSLLGHLITAS